MRKRLIASLSVLASAGAVAVAAAPPVAASTPGCIFSEITTSKITAKCSSSATPYRVAAYCTGTGKNVVRYGPWVSSPSASSMTCSSGSTRSNGWIEFMKSNG